MGQTLTNAAGRGLRGLIALCVAAAPSQAALMAALRPTPSPLTHRTGANGLPRPASAGDIAALGAGLSQREGLAAPTTSKNSGGSELFDALLMAATGTAAAAAGAGDATPVGAGGTAGSPGGGGGGEQQVRGLRSNTG